MRTAYLAMEKVFSKPYTTPADATVMTMVDVLQWVVIPELANIAVVTRCRYSTVDTHI